MYTFTKLKENAVTTLDLPAKRSSITTRRVFTGSIASSAKRRYLIYSETDFEVLRPAGATRCTDGGEVWRGGGTETELFLLRFDQNVEYKTPIGAYSLRDYHKICTLCTPFQDALAVKISLDLLMGLWSYRGFKLTWSGCPKFSAPPSGETMHQTPKSFQGARTCLSGSPLGLDPPLSE